MLRSTFKIFRSFFNFYRLHLLAFLTVPLLGSVVIWASNGKFPVRFVDSLFVSVSGATGTGLVTIDLSALTAWQQVVIVILELVGNQTTVAWVVVVVRRWYFLRNLRHIVAAEMQRTGTLDPQQDSISPRQRHIRETLKRLKRERESEAANGQLAHKQSRDVRPNSHQVRLRADMVRRLDVAPRLIDPMGADAPSLPSEAVAVSSQEGTEPGLPVPSPASSIILRREASRRSTRRQAEPAPAPLTGATAATHTEDDFGCLPDVGRAFSRALGCMSPRLKHKLKRTLTMPRTETLVPRTPSLGAPPVHRDADTADTGAGMLAEGSVKPVPYLSFSATVRRNSAFYGLTTENVEELGGVEYRALSALLWIIPVYYAGILLLAFAVTAPYMSLPRWADNFVPPLQHRIIDPIWFSAFQIIGGWSNTGMSLVDQNMAPFQTAYPLMIFLVICVLAGNTCLPVFLRFFIWLLTKLPGQSRHKESLHFLLDHPRRCTIYLFPSRQTWLLVGTILVLNCTNLFFYIILDIGNSATEDIPFGIRFLDGIVFAAACRNAGYQPVPVSSLVPAVQVLFIVMMYISIYPIAMSVRATNVYEERSLGVYEDDGDALDDELNDDTRWNAPAESRVAIWGRYLARHARRQLSFDMWWLAVSLFLLCIVERSNLTDSSKISYFNVFALIFEVVSAYGTVGLSLGIPGRNYSLSGGMHTLSKLIICVVMLRGRHRGLPVALDRAVLLPSEFLPSRSPRSSPSSGGGDSTKMGGEADVLEVNGGSVGAVQDPEALAERMRMRARTISLIVERRQDNMEQMSMRTIRESGRTLPAVLD